MAEEEERSSTRKRKRVMKARTTQHTTLTSVTLASLVADRDPWREKLSVWFLSSVFFFRDTRTRHAPAHTHTHTHTHTHAHTHLNSNKQAPFPLLPTAFPRFLPPAHHPLLSLSLSLSLFTTMENVAAIKTLLRELCSGKWEKALPVWKVMDKLGEKHPTTLVRLLTSCLDDIDDGGMVGRAAVDVLGSSVLNAACRPWGDLMTESGSSVLQRLHGKLLDVIERHDCPELLRRDVMDLMRAVLFVDSAIQHRGWHDLKLRVFHWVERAAVPNDNDIGGGGGANGGGGGSDDDDGGAVIGVVRGVAGGVGAAGLAGAAGGGAAAGAAEAAAAAAMATGVAAVAAGGASDRSLIWRRIVGWKVMTYTVLIQFLYEDDARPDMTEDDLHDVPAEIPALLEAMNASLNDEDFDDDDNDDDNDGDNDGDNDDDNDDDDAEDDAKDDAKDGGDNDNGGNGSGNANGNVSSNGNGNAPTRKSRRATKAAVRSQRQAERVAAALALPNIAPLVSVYPPLRLPMCTLLLQVCELFNDHNLTAQQHALAMRTFTRVYDEQADVFKDVAEPAAECLTRVLLMPQPEIVRISALRALACILGQGKGVKNPALMSQIAVALCTVLIPRDDLGAGLMGKPLLERKAKRKDEAGKGKDESKDDSKSESKKGKGVESAKKSKDGERGKGPKGRSKRSKVALGGGDDDIDNDDDKIGAGGDDDDDNDGDEDADRVVYEGEEEEGEEEEEEEEDEDDENRKATRAKRLRRGQDGDGRGKKVALGKRSSSLTATTSSSTTATTGAAAPSNDDIWEKQVEEPENLFIELAEQTLECLIAMVCEPPEEDSGDDDDGDNEGDEDGDGGDEDDDDNDDDNDDDDDDDDDNNHDDNNESASKNTGKNKSKKNETGDAGKDDRGAGAGGASAKASATLAQAKHEAAAVEFLSNLLGLLVSWLKKSPRDWRRQCGALRALGVTPRRSLEVLTEPMKSLIVDALLFGANSPHARVRWAAFEGLNRMSVTAIPLLAANKPAVSCVCVVVLKLFIIIIIVIISIIIIIIIIIISIIIIIITITIMIIICVFVCLAFYLVCFPCLFVHLLVIAFYFISIFVPPVPFPLC